MNNSNTALLQSCRCRWIALANSHPAAHDLWLTHIFEATTEGHVITREMAVSMPIDGLGLSELRTHIETLNRVDRRRAVENDVFYHADTMVIASENKLIRMCINAAGVSIVAALLVWDLFRML